MAEQAEAPARAAQDKRNIELTLDSTFFVAFDLTHRALKSGLASASTLNVTQYRLLVKLFATHPNALPQTELGRLLSLKANVVTQAANALETAGYAQRIHAAHQDGRVRPLMITEAGIKHVAQVNASIVNMLYALFPTEDAGYRSILEASIAAGAGIEAPTEGNVSGTYAASRALVSLELVKRGLEEALNATCNGASLTECRVLQRLGEVGEPVRVGDLAHQLQMSAVAVARAADKLAERGWVMRLASPHDRKAVFLDTTDAGRRQQKAIERTIDVLARKQLWHHLNTDQQQALARAWHVVVADVLAREEAKRKAALGMLRPMD